MAVAADPLIKLIFLCSPGNPTGTLVRLSDIREILDDPNFKGIVAVDEAYIDFAGSDASAATLVDTYANLCVMQTLSKGFGLAAIRFVVLLNPHFKSDRRVTETMQAWYCVSATAVDSSPLEYESTIQHLHPDIGTGTPGAVAAFFGEHESQPSHSYCRPFRAGIGSDAFIQVWAG